MVFAPGALRLKHAPMLWNAQDAPVGTGAAPKAGHQVSASRLHLAGLVTGRICHFGLWRLAALVEEKCRLNALKAYTSVRA